MSSASGAACEPPHQSEQTGCHAYHPLYRARERYFLLKTCNTWTAQALRMTGAPITAPYALTAGNVMGQVRRLATAEPSE